MTRNEKKAVIESMAEKFMNIDDLEGKSMTIMVMSAYGRQRVLQMEILHYILFCLIFYLILPLKCHLVRLQTKLTKGSHAFLS